jgi:hypothetical protein
VPSRRGDEQPGAAFHRVESGGHERCYKGGMTKVRMALPLAILGGWLVGAGCDDDRGVVDLGAGGDVAQPGGAAGTAGAGGDETTPGGAGAGAGGAAGGAAAGAGGAAAGEGGAGGALECPANIFAADGKACASEGMFCSDGGDDPCQFGQSIVCRSGKWRRQEAFPAPCGGAGGAGGQGGGGAGGAP